MKVLLTGAAGSVGRATLINLLEHYDYEISILELKNKRTMKRLKPYLKNVKTYFGSVNDKDFIDEIVKEQDVVIHLAAIIPPLADNNPELARQVNYFGTKNIIEAISKSNKQTFLLYASSISVYGDRVNDPYIKVSDPCNYSEGDYYALTKIETEQMIIDSGIDYSIFRLTGIMEHPKTDPLMFHMPLSTKLEIATVSDTARAFVNALEHLDELKQRTFNLGGGESCRTTYLEFMKNMFKIYGLNFRYLKEMAFATKNFHCGYYMDGDDLEDIIHFRRDSLESYYEKVREETKSITRFFARLFSRPILYFLNKKSEPLQAQKKENKSLIKRFFGENKQNSKK